MSYIRPLSNPEGLYIYEIATKGTRMLRIHCDEHGAGITMPLEQFHKLAIAYDKEGLYQTRSLTYKQSTLRETKDYQIQFAYKKQSFSMCQVTWEYLVQDVLRREQRGLETKIKEVFHAGKIKYAKGKSK